MSSTLDGIRVTDSAAGVGVADLEGFFAGWPAHPTPGQHLAIMQASAYVSVAWRADEEVVGFITAISDGMFAAYISLLEVRSAFRARGIGSALVDAMKRQVAHCYMVDLICDADLLAFYERRGMTRYTGAVIRNPDALRHPLGDRQGRSVADEPPEH